MSANYIIGLTKSDLSLHIRVDRSDFNQTLLVFKYNIFFLTNHQTNLKFTKTFRTYLKIHFPRFGATMSP